MKKNLIILVLIIIAVKVLIELPKAINLTNKINSLSIQQPLPTTKDYLKVNNSKKVSNEYYIKSDSEKYWSDTILKKN